MRTVHTLLVIVLVPLGLVTTERTTPAETAPAGTVPSYHSPTIEPADQVAAEDEHHVSLTPAVTVVGADAGQRDLLDRALASFRENGLALPDVEVRYSDDEADCGGHLGLFQKKYTPWRLLVCSDFTYIPYHELAHAWEAANVDDATRARYIEARGLTNWNAAASKWAERGVEDAARMIQLNLMVTHVQPELPIWQERLEAYELLVGRPSPVLDLPEEKPRVPRDADARRQITAQPAGPA